MDVRIALLGGFSVSVEGRTVPAEDWSRRQAAGLVKLLALSRGRRLHREQVIAALWPDASVDAAAPRLHKAAHFARRALGDQAGAVVLRHDLVSLLPGGHVVVDVEEFRSAAGSALAAGSPAQAEQALASYGGPLLPDDVYEPWTEAHRRSLDVLHADLLRLAGRWEELLAVQPVDEEAHLALARRAADRGDVRGALRQLERMEQALRRELGTPPSAEADALRRELAAREPVAPTTTRRTTLVGRRADGDRVRAALADAAHGRGSTLVVTGAPGVGKTAVAELAVALAHQQGWRVGTGSAAAIEGPWPYAPVLEALGDVCRTHPTLLDGLDDRYRTEIERALAGRDMAWSGESEHQRLFMATAELLRVAAAGHGLLLVVDDLHEADEASLRLLHYLARCAVSEQVVLLLAHRPTTAPAVLELTGSLVSRGIGARLPLEPLPEPAARRLASQVFPEADEETLSRIWALSGGVPFTVLETARAARTGGSGAVEPALPAAVRRTLQRVALLGGRFSTDELLVAAGTTEQEAYLQLETALTARVVEVADGGYRFRHTLVRERLLDGMPPYERTTAHRQLARRLAELGEAPGRVAHQFLAGGAPGEAVPFVLRAVETSGALGAYRDALVLVDGVLAHARDPERGHLLARRGDLLMALGDPESVRAYQAAVPATSGTEHRLVRARLARAMCFTGDFDTARAALSGLELAGDAADGPLLLAQGHLAYFVGDVEGAWDAASRARGLLQTPDDPWHYLDLVGLQGLIAHDRGEWFERFRQELRHTSSRPGLETALFDAHLCVAEYLLYGPVPYAEVIELSEDLRGRARAAGALRGLAFATALIGEAALLMGDLDRAERELEEAVDLHRDADAPAGEAASLQRLAEVRLEQGRAEEARALLARALPLARWSVLSMHLLQRIHGTLVRAAPDPPGALLAVDRAEATLGDSDRCLFCDVMFEVPAAIACACGGDPQAARRHLEKAEVCAARWEGPAWEAAVLEARAYVEGDGVPDPATLEAAARLFLAAGQPLDARRCRPLVPGAALSS